MFAKCVILLEGPEVCIDDVTESGSGALGVHFGSEHRRDHIEILVNTNYE